MTALPAMAIKRAAEAALPADGMRVLVERRWPAGKRRDDVAVDLWLREAAPSARLRRWYGHDPRRWQGFREKYRAELARQPDVLHMLDDLRRRTPVTLLFSAADEARNNAAVLREMLEGETR